MANQATVISDLLSRAMGNGYLLIDNADLPADFFKLNTGLAGELFQKFVNYQLPLAIVVNDVFALGSRFAELIREHHSPPLIRFFTDTDSANAWLPR